MGICILAKRAVLELGSSTNFVYSLRILLCRILSYHGRFFLKPDHPLFPSPIFIQQMFNFQIQILRHMSRRHRRYFQPQMKFPGRAGRFDPNHHTPLFKKRDHHIIHAVVMKRKIAKFLPCPVFQIKPVLSDAGRIQYFFRG